MPKKSTIQNPELVNNHNVYILGAGFSRDAGGPLIGDFLLRMRDCHEHLLADGKNLEANAIADVLKFRQEAASAAYWTKLDLENIEDLFSLASANSRKLTPQICNAIAATIDRLIPPIASSKIRLVVADDHLHEIPQWLATRPDLANQEYEIPEYANHVARLLGLYQFLDGNPVGRNSFITFNYDTVLEQALEYLGMEYDYHLSPRADVSTSGAQQKKVPLFKLHGSINWSGGPKGKGINVFKDYQTLSALNKTPALIPPTWKKEFGTQFSAVWDGAIRALKTATNVVVIGFSAPPTDLHFKYLLASGFQGNISLRRLQFFTKDASLLSDRVGRLFRDEYIESAQIKDNRIKVIGGGLDELTRGQGRLAEIGRPIPGSIRVAIPGAQSR